MADALRYTNIDKISGEQQERVKVTLDINLEDWHNIRRVAQQVRLQEQDLDMQMDQILVLIVMEHGASIGFAEVAPNDPVATRPAQEKPLDRSLIVRGPVQDRAGVVRFMVANPDSKREYSIVRTDDTWSCQCKDYLYRQVVCKHIRAARDHLVKQDPSLSRHA